MIQPGTYVTIADKTGATLGHVIKILGPRRKRRSATIGDIVLLSIVWENVKPPRKRNVKFKNRFKKGSLHKGMIIRVKTNRIITSGSWVKYGENAVCLVSSKGIPLSKRCKGPISRQLCLKKPVMGCVARLIL